MKTTFSIIMLFLSVQTFCQDLIKVGVDNLLHINGTGTTALGIKSGDAITTGSYNTFIGYNSGLKNTSGASNTLVGYFSGYNLSTGIGNTLMGTNSGQSLTTGIRNSFFGHSSGLSITGNNNVAFGRSAGAFATSGSNNTFIGEESGEGSDINLITGSNNTFLGHLSGNKTTTGSDNIFIGVSSGYFMTTGQQNIFIGKNSGSGSETDKNLGSNNVFMGYNTGYKNTTGKENTSLGNQAGDGNTTGSYNVYIGSNSDGFGANAANLERSAAIGYNAKVSINDAIVLGDTDNSNIKVGIGIHNPQYKLDVKGVVNMRVAFNSPVIKVNDKDFIFIDKSGSFVIPSFKLKYDNQSQWADNVFDSTYKLKPIEEITDFTTKNKHLPNIPSAKEVVENGLNINEILPKMLTKIEELTIYIIQINEENKKLKNEILELKNKKID